MRRCRCCSRGLVLLLLAAGTEAWTSGLPRPAAGKSIRSSRRLNGLQARLPDTTVDVAAQRGSKFYEGRQGEAAALETHDNSRPSSPRSKRRRRTRHSPDLRVPHGPMSSELSGMVLRCEKTGKLFFTTKEAELVRNVLLHQVLRRAPRRQDTIECLI